MVRAGTVGPKPAADSDLQDPKGSDRVKVGDSRSPGHFDTRDDRQVIPERGCGIEMSVWGIGCPAVIFSDSQPPDRT